MNRRSPRLKLNRLLYTRWDHSRARGQLSKAFIWLVCRHLGQLVKKRRSGHWTVMEHV